MTTPQYEVDPNNEKLISAKQEGDAMLKDFQSDMDSAIQSNETAMNNALDSIGEMGKDGKWTPNTPTAMLADAQNKETEFVIEQIEQEKEKAHKDYIKEQSGAYTDYQKQINPYGVNAEQMAASGLSKTGYSESSKVSMYNQYQARITAARESYLNIVQDFNNGITQARLQNNSTIAQIYVDAMEKRMNIMMQYAMKGIDLIVTKSQQSAAIRQQNYSNYLAVYNQIMDELKLKETARQHNESHAFQREQFEWQKEQAAKKAATISKSSSGGSGSGSKTAQSRNSGSSGSRTLSKEERDQVKKGEPKVDMQSVLALGHGPISAEKLNSLIVMGFVEEYQEGGLLKYRNVMRK